MVKPPFVSVSVIAPAFTAWGVPSAPKASTLPPARVGESDKNAWMRLVEPVDQPELVEAGKLKAAPDVSTDGEAAVAIGKLAWVLGTAMRA